MSGRTMKRRLFRLEQMIDRLIPGWLLTGIVAALAMGVIIGFTIHYVTSYN